jgi:hypothetical protein
VIGIMPISLCLRIGKGYRDSRSNLEGNVALVERLEAAAITRPSIHESVDCGYAIVDAEGRRVLQVETYGSRNRKMRGKMSQTLQFTEDAARELRRIIEVAFPEK